jgi:lipopolysaccharide transport system ATP-binding protein
MDRPIVGFYVKDRLGLNLFGDNTFLRHVGEPIACRAEGRLTARFEFEVPCLNAGVYFFSCAVADGIQADHVMHHWLHEAMVLTSTTESVAHGLVGIPIDAELAVCEPPAHEPA